MTLSQRRPREAYRIYGEDEYLAGADALAGWDTVPAEETKQGRRLQRVAGAAALTGAVGTVGGVVGLAVLHAHSGERRDVAERLVPSIRTAAPHGSAGPAHATHRHVAVRSRPRRRRAHTRARVHLALAPAPRTESPARAITASAPQNAPAPVASTAQHTPAEAEPGPRAQSEFGFER